MKHSVNLVNYRKKFTLTLGAVFLLIAGGIVPSNSQSVQVIGSVPFTTTDSIDFFGTNIGVPIISVEVNGHPAKLIFDTGTTSNFVTEGFAERYGLIDDNTTTSITDATGNTADAKTYDLLAIKIGSYIIKSNVLSAKDYNFADASGTESDGILGKIACDNAAVLISPTLKTLTFYVPGNLTRQQLKKIGMGDAIAFSLKLTKNNMLSTTVAFKQKSVVVSDELIIDTGSERTIVSERAFKTLKGDIVSKGAFITRLRRSVVTDFTVEQAILGTLSVSNPIIACSASKTLHISPTLGRDILSHYQVLIDTPAMMMYLLPDAIPLPPQKNGSWLSLDDN